MANFSYRAVDGDANILTGKLQARDENDLEQKLGMQGLTLIEGVKASFFDLRKHTITFTQQELANFSYFLHLIVSSGMPILNGLVDLRENLSLSRKAVYASRIVLRSSFGKEGSRFYMGGPWSLRGYTTRAMSGKTLLLMNNELRLPVLARVILRFPGQRLPLPAIKGALFADVGGAGEKELDTWRGSLGFGLYLGGGYFPIIRFNTVWRTDFTTLNRKPVREFFVGWNF